MIKLEPILDMDLSEEPMPEPMMDFIGNRLEYVQRKRLRLLQDIEKSYTYKDIAGDEGLSITYTSTLRDLEKQELAKYKTKREEEAGDKDARAALFAAEVINEFRRARRDGTLPAEKVESVTIPAIGEQLDGVEPDHLAMSDRQFKEMNYDEFRRQLIESGIDKFNKIDENGKIVPIVPAVADGE